MRAASASATPVSSERAGLIATASSAATARCVWSLGAEPHARRTLRDSTTARLTAATGSRSPAKILRERRAQLARRLSTASTSGSVSLPSRRSANSSFRPLTAVVEHVVHELERDAELFPEVRHRELRARIGAGDARPGARRPREERRRLVAQDALVGGLGNVELDPPAQLQDLAFDEPPERVR